MTPAERKAYASELRRLAANLNLPPCDNLEKAILDYYIEQLSRWITAYAPLESLSGLFDLIAGCLELEVVEIHNDEDLLALLQRIEPTREPIMARLASELDDETDGITIRRIHREPWERPFLAVINCRGRHNSRRFFSKWHEVAHRLIDGQELIAAYRRTPTTIGQREPEEILVDRIAAALAFHPDVFRPAFLEELERAGQFSFNVVGKTRARAAPEASRQAILLACVHRCPQPLHFVRCEMRYKREEERRLASPQVNMFPELELTPQAKLRVAEVVSSPAALMSKIRFHENMQVPETSIVAQAFHDSLGLPQFGMEELEAWQTSSGGPIGRGHLRVEAVGFVKDVWAILFPPQTRD